MKRDIEIVRKRLLRAEAADGGVSINDLVETYHVRIMIDAGLIEGRISEEITSGGPGHSHIHNLTWTGHEFLEKRLDIFLPFQKLGARKAGL